MKTAKKNKAKINTSRKTDKSGKKKAAATGKVKATVTYPNVRGLG